jgi:uncharacterized protein involved in outer membrane biogenesis
VRLLTRLFKPRGNKTAIADVPPVSPRRRRWPRIALWSIGIFATLVLFGFLGAPPIVKSQLESRLTEKLGRQVTIGEIRINPLILAVEINDFQMREKESSERFLAFEKLRVDLELESVLRRAPVLREVYLSGAYVNAVRLDAQRYNFTDILEAFAKEEPDDEEPARFAVHNIQIVAASADFDDRPRHTKHQVRDLRLAIPFVSNLPTYVDVFVQPNFAARVNGTPFGLVGKTKPFSPMRETSVDLSIAGLDLPFYLEYVPLELQYKPVSARLDADLQLTFAQPPNAAPRLIVTGKTSVEDFAVQELSGAPLLSFPRLTVVLDSVDVFERKIGIKSVTLDRPDITARRARDGSLNLMILASVQQGGAALGEVRKETKAAESPTPGRSGTAKAPLIRVGEIRVEQGRVAFVDEVPDTPFRATVAPLDIALTGFATSAGTRTGVRLEALTDANEKIVVEGAYGFAEAVFDGRATVSGMPIRRYAPYYAQSILFDILDGTVDASTGFTFVNDPTSARILANDLGASVAGLRLRKRGASEDFLRLARLAISGARFDLQGRTLDIGEVESNKAALEVERARDGSLNLSGLTPAPSGGPSSAPAPDQRAPQPSRTGETPWVVTLNRVALDDYSVRIRDAVPAEPVTIKLAPIKLTAENLVIGKPAKGKLDLSLKVNETGTVRLAGTVQPEPLAASLKVVLKDIAIEPFQAYFADQVNITVTDGTVSADGTVTANLPPGGALAYGYEGTAAINRLATVDKVSAEDFLKWQSLFFEGIKLKSAPFFLEMKQVALSDFYSRLIVFEDGTLNVQSVVAKSESAPAAAGQDAPPKEAAKAAPDAKRAKRGKQAKTQAETPKPQGPSAVEAVTRLVKIDQVTLQGGTIRFTDRFVKPNVTATLNEVGGRITGLMSDPSSRADVDLRGRLGNQAPLEITGKINPLAGDLFADIKVAFRDIELPPFTPYSGKYAGYTIAKGKLSMELAYLIDQRKLTAENRVFIDQFEFGDKVESPDAVNLPVSLAVSLLKDSQGRINLDVPVSGSLDDPKFRLGKVIWQVIVNLVTKIVTSPFALLGSLGGGGEQELSYVQFEYGSAKLEAQAEAKLETLAKALRDRPALKLEASAYVDAERDPEALRKAILERKIKAQKLKDLAKRGEAPPSVDDVSIAPGEEYETYLERAYKAEKFPKPRNLIGLTKELPVPEMEKLMLTNIVVGPDELRLLALQRAQAVRDHLTTKGQVPSERIFLVEPKSPSPEAKKDVKASRVEFKLR